MSILRAMPLVLLAAACVHAPPPPAPPSESAPPPTATDPLPAIRSSVEALLRIQAEVFWKGLTTGGAVDVAATYRGQEQLLAPETLEQVKKARESATGDEQRALSYLHTFLVGEWLARDSAMATDRSTAAEATIRMKWNGREVPVRQLERLLAIEPNAERRAGLERAYGAVAPKLLPLAMEEEQAVRQAAQKLGYASALALAVESRGQSAEGLAALAEELLSRTEGVYRVLMDSLARSEIHVPLASTHFRDLPRLFQTAHEHRGFPAAELIPDALATFDSLGLEPRKTPGLTLDLEARPGKSSRPIVLPVQIPTDVRVSVVPQGGATEARALMHELGAAIFYARINQSTMEFRRLGPATVAETWAMLFEALTGDPTWLAERTGLTGTKLARELRANLAEELHQARLEAARLLCELERVRNPAQAAEAQRRLLARALVRPVEADEAALWPLEPDPMLHTAEVLRARLLAAQAEAHLIANAKGPAWWRSLENGKWLARTWSDGTRPSPQELAASMGQSGVDAGPYASRAKARAVAAGITPP